MVWTHPHAELCHCYFENARSIPAFARPLSNVDFLETARGVGQHCRIVVAWVVVATLAEGSLCLGRPQEPPPRPDTALSVEVVEGDGAIVNVRGSRAHDPVVLVTDKNGRPVPHAAVTFMLPAAGAGGSFLDGQRTTTVRTSADGKASALGLKPNKVAGPFEIRVTASANGEMGRAVVHMTNVDPSGGGNSKKKLIILTAVAGAVAGGVLAASGGGGSTSPAQPTTQPGTIIPGSPTVGAPR